ncbi:MAG: fructosamine kinase family protein [Vicinamibacteria bacterium]
MPQALVAGLRQALSDERLELHGLEPVGGGCISHAARARTSAGELFVKWNDAVPPDLFLREAEGLRALGEAGSGLVVPRVHGATSPGAQWPALIVLEDLGPAGPYDEEALGRGLARLHGRTDASYGFPGPSYCGTTRQDNAPGASWPEFYRDRRLRPLLALAERGPGLAGDAKRTYETLLARVAQLLAHETSPSLVHGDLWSGNVLGSARGPALVDPACAHADREYELGITTLFGGFGARFFAAYEEEWPLPHGWRERNPLYQLYHLLNHYVLFGGAYGSQALRIARRFL